MEEKIKQHIRQALALGSLYQVLDCLADVVEERQSEYSAHDVRQIPKKIRQFRADVWTYIGSGD